MEEIKIFKIKDKNTGLFSTGTKHPTWTKKGKIWNQINHIKTHLRQFCDEKITWTGLNDFEYSTKWINNIPENWLVFEYSSINGIKEYSAKELYKPTEILNYIKKTI